MTAIKVHNFGKACSEGLVVVVVCLALAAAIFGVVKLFSACTSEMCDPVFEGSVGGYEVRYFENFQPLYGRARNELIVEGVELPDKENVVTLLLQDKIGWHKLPFDQIEPNPAEYVGDVLEVVVVRYPDSDEGGGGYDLRITVEDLTSGTYTFAVFELGQSLYTDLRAEIQVRLQEEWAASLPAP